MSHAFYNLQWQQAMEKLSEQLEIENPIEPEDVSGGKAKADPGEQKIERNDAWLHFACLYVRYIQIFRELEDCYDQIVHPQKRADLKIVLDVVMARLCQVKQELYRFTPEGNVYLKKSDKEQWCIARSQGDYLILDELILDLKLSPDKLEIPIPRYFQLRPDDCKDIMSNRQLAEQKLEENGNTLA